MIALQRPTIYINFLGFPLLDEGVFIRNRTDVSAFYPITCHTAELLLYVLVSLHLR